MSCFSICGSNKSSKMQNTSSETRSFRAMERYRDERSTNEQVLLRVPACTVYLMDGGEVMELANGEFLLERILEENVPLATIVKVGTYYQWPLTKDEPIVKLDPLHYLFSLPMSDGEPISYGVTFPEKYQSNLGVLDSFLKENSCFSATATTKRKNNVDWTEYAPRIENYNNFLSQTIARGTGQIIRGIFICSNGYANQVQRGGETILAGAAEDKRSIGGKESYANQSSNETKSSGINNSLKRARNLSNMTEKLSKTMLNGVGIATGSVMAPVLRSQAGKTIFSMVPGEALLASLDAVNKILDAAEVAQKQALSATSESATGMITRRFGESAGEATGDMLATAGHCAGTAWNVFKFRKAITPSSATAKHAAKNRNGIL